MPDTDEIPMGSESIEMDEIPMLESIPMDEIPMLESIPMDEVPMDFDSLPMDEIPIVFDSVPLDGFSTDMESKPDKDEFRPFKGLDKSFVFSFRVAVAIRASDFELKAR